MRLERSRLPLWPAFCGSFFAAALAVGCASPAGPRPPSLQLPQPVRDLAALRSGGDVEIRFTVPSRTTDGVGIRGGSMTAVLCRQDGTGSPCRVVDAEQTANPLHVPAAGTSEPVVWRDALPALLAEGPARPVAYRVELRNTQGKSAGFSDPVYAAAGSAPATVEDFAAEGTRPGVLLKWRPEPAAAGRLLVERTRLDAVTEARPHEEKPARQAAHGVAAQRGIEARRSHASTDRDQGRGIVWLEAGSGDAAGTPEMVDGTIEEGVRYRYSAVRSVTARIGGRTLELRSAPSIAAEIAWRDVYPPAGPTGLTALGYATPGTGAGQPGYAVDLVWQPVNDPRVTGYVVRRQRLGPAGLPVGSPEQLTAQPVSAPGYHDGTAAPMDSYRYEVTAVDAKGNVSAPAKAEVQPLAR